MRGPLLALALLGTGCSSPVSVERDATTAQQTRERLEQVGIAARLRSSGDGSSTVWVPSADAERALQRLDEPAARRPESGGPLGNLVPSRRQVQQRADQELSEAISATLEALDDVDRAHVLLSPAHVHVLPGIEDPSAQSATVVVTTSSERFDVDRIRRIVARAVPKLAPERIEIATARGEPRPAPTAVARFGPVSIPETARVPLRWMFGGLVGINLITLVGLLYFYRRVRVTPPREPG